MDKVIISTNHLSLDQMMFLQMFYFFLWFANMTEHFIYPI